MPYHIARWKDRGGIQSMEQWDKNIQNLRVFANERADTMRWFMQKKYHLSETCKVTIQSEDENGKSISGNVKLNSLTINTFPWTGIYFKNLPVRAEAMDWKGFEFKEWKENPETKHEIIVLPKDSVLKLIAVYKR